MAVRGGGRGGAAGVGAITADAGRGSSSRPAGTTVLVPPSRVGAAKTLGIVRARATLSTESPGSKTNAPGMAGDEKSSAT